MIDTIIEVQTRMCFYQKTDAPQNKDSVTDLTSSMIEEMLK